MKLSDVPSDAVGLRLCKITAKNLVMCEPVIFKNGHSAVQTTLSRAAISGSVGPVGKTGDYWADFINENGDWTETVRLDKRSYSILKNRWMRCKIAA